VQRRAEAIRRSAGMDFVVVTDRNGIRYSHPNPAQIGEHVSTDPTDALRGGTVLAIETGTLGRSARAKVPLRGSDGRVVGVVSVGILEGALHREIADLVPAMAVYLVVALGVGVLASLLLARRLKRQTFGLELHEIAALVQEREAMLHGIREGVIIVDPEGRLLLVNDEARRLTGLSPSSTGAPLGEAVGSGRLADVVAGRVGGTDLLVVRGDRLLVVNRTPVRRNGRDLGAIVTLRDRTELEALVRELDSVRSLTDAMRAQAHEFSNRLHALAGMLAMGRHDDAAQFIAEVTETDEDLRRQLAERIADPRIAALLLAKSAVAAERGVRLILSDDSRLDQELIDAREGLTIVGNLVDNALDAAAAGDDRPALVRVHLADEAGALLVRVRDSGVGVPDDARTIVFEAGFTTKGEEGRGVGLSLVRQLVERRGGWIEVEDPQEGSGAVFTAWLPEAVAGGTEVSA
jgi:two-component system CitB family sensor kinase